eukprot:TRINITY_DN1523_c0_g1_i1.p1 TRINITY_DN1523_c0_g1~~TRINITY_DN1523_c0_g1_i1.p1  ORF type:complete len:332 (+),score=73.10 TRINITY_DN1523_c0_g1_i1:274-1269(+)
MPRKSESKKGEGKKKDKDKGDKDKEKGEKESYCAPTTQRVDLGELKKRLTLVLKHHTADYWISVKKFLLAQLTKQELDHFAREWLGDNIWLHNRFFQGLINNAHHAQPPKLPTRKSASGATQPAAASTSSAASTKKTSSKKKKKSKTDSAKKSDAPPQPEISAPKTVSEELRKAALQPISAICKRSQPVGVGLPHVHRLGRKAQRTLPVSQSDHEFIGSPRLLALRQKMLQTALTWGLADVGNDAVEYMMAALETHMKHIIGVCNSRVPLNKKRLQALRSSVKPPLVPPTRYTVGSKEFRAALDQGHGNSQVPLLAANAPLVRERIGMQQH